METVQLTGNVKRRWQFVKQFFHESQETNFWVDINKFAIEKTKTIMEYALEEEMSKCLAF